MAGIVTLMLTACGKKTTNVNDLNGEWTVKEINGKNLDRDQNAWLGFDVAQKRVYGNLGANSVVGVLNMGKQHGSIDLSKLGTTMMMGTPEQMKLEDNLSKTLATVKTYELRRDGKLELRNAAGKNVVLLEKRNERNSNTANNPANMNPNTNGNTMNGTAATPAQTGTDRRDDRRK